MQEEKGHYSAWFITLTYAPATVPISPNGFMTLDRPKKVVKIGKKGKNKGKTVIGWTNCHLQLFLKKLRKAHSHVGIKYYVCGEYGSKKSRPHYHMIIFGVDVEKIQAAWPHGEIYYGTVTGASIGYVLKYMSKPPREKIHARDDRVPEFSMMSKGLGAKYCTEQMKNWHNADPNNRLYVNVEPGVKAAMPRYYRKRIYNADRLSEVIGYQKGLQERRSDEQAAKRRKGYHAHKARSVQTQFLKMALSASKRM